MSENQATGCAAPFKGYALVRPRDAEDDDGPCGRKVVVSVGGRDVASERLCVSHWLLKHGHADFQAPVVVEP